jgi:hypothetical protein
VARRKNQQTHRSRSSRLAGAKQNAVLNRKTLCRKARRIAANIAKLPELLRTSK